MNEIVTWPASRIADAIRQRDVSAVEVTMAFLDRIETVNPEINAIVHVEAESALRKAKDADKQVSKGEALGLLHGVPVTVKERFFVEGLPSTGGSEGRKGFSAPADATTVARMREAGAIILGLTNVCEMCLGYESDNLIYGRTNNPHNVERTPGGSSGGEGAILAAGGSALGLAHDAAGSIRLPSHYCGVVGIKPTTGRVPSTGYGNTSPDGYMLHSLGQAGPMARTIDDLTLALEVLSGPDWIDASVAPFPMGAVDDCLVKDLRVAFYTDNGIMQVEPELVDTVKNVANSFSDLGATVTEARPIVLEQTWDLVAGLFGVGGGKDLEAVLSRIGTENVSPMMTRLIELLRPFELDIRGYRGLLSKCSAYQGEMLGFMRDYDLILSPVVPFPALPHGTSFDDSNFKGYTYMACYNLTGWPAAVVRAGTTSDGLPIGVQIASRPWREDIVLAAAKAIELTTENWTIVP